MKAKFYILFFVSFLISGKIFSQDTLHVGDDLNQLVQEAESGAVIIISQGFHDAQTESITILDKSLTFKGEEGEEKPLVYVSQLNFAGTDVDLKFEGLELTGITLVDSITGESTDTVLAGDYLVNLTADNVSTDTILFTNCIIHGFNRSIIRGDRSPAHTANAIILDNSIAYDFRGGGDYGPFRMKSNITVNHFIIRNSTMYDFLNKLVDFQDVVSSPMEVVVENCTFYNWGGGKDGNYLFDIEDNDQANLKIKNCILGKTNDDSVLVNGFRFREEATTSITNSVLTPDFDLDTTGAYENVAWDVDEWNTVDFDPEFEDPENGNFNIPAGSDIRQMSDEGGPIGDPRWVIAYSSTDRFTENMKITVYPVPARNILYIQTEKPGNCVLYNVLGKAVREIRIEDGSVYPVHIEGLTPGVYFIRMQGMNGSQKILIE